MRPGRPRALPAAVLSILAALLLAVSGALFYIRAEIVHSRAFGNRLVSALDNGSVRTVATNRIVDGLVNASSGDALAVRPVISTAVSAVIGTPAFREVALFAAQNAHRTLVRGDSSIVVEIRRDAVALLDALRSVSPAVAARIPSTVHPEVVDVNSDNTDLRAVRRLIDWTRFRWVALAVAACCLAAAAFLAGGLRGALTCVGGAVAVAGAIVAAAVTVGESLAKAKGATLLGAGGAERSAIGAVWNALFGDLRKAALTMLAGGAVCAGLAAVVVDPRRPFRRVAEALERRPVPRAVRSAVLLLAGVACLLAPDTALRVLALAVGVALVVVALAPIVPPPATGEASGPVKTGLLAVAGAVVVIGAATAAIVIALGAPGQPLARTPQVAGACNGLRQLCDRRIDDVFFAATHNSYAAADEPGWLFPNQRYAIERQLNDGIRGLLIDVHHGVLDRQSGRVRTDLRADGSDRNKAAKALSPEALHLADRLAGRVGAGTLTGSRGLYLCHTLCELGAEPLDQELSVIRRFLQREPGQVVVVVVEDYVPPDQIEAAFQRTGLIPFVAELDRAAPLPTLGQLVEKGKRLLVFTEANGGEPSWYMPAFSYMQDTPYQVMRREQFRCRRYRGNADSPLLLLNHWIARFPPRASDQARSGGTFLKERAARCAEERGIRGAIVAVDFYERTGVVQAIRELNGRP